MILVTQVVLLTTEEVLLRHPVVTWKRVDELFDTFRDPALFLRGKAIQVAGLMAFKNVTNELHKAIFTQRTVGMLLVPLSLSLMTSAYVDLPLKEHTSGALTIQLMAGLSSERYWLLTFFWDMTAHFVACIFCTLPLLFFEWDMPNCLDYTKVGKLSLSA
ncbi:uncharacterized protein LOC120847923 [Ixodes scapularis]|uniref:uncharacterized protein LOC120847923 n=1 Tax=Ixodes scapularis TaxID=6945 RepID=UPI001A9DD7D4|nr:uncharacterized protein LOC120847923 [Ixodes scapularis]